MIGYLVALLLAVAWGSIVQTQFNITSLQSIGGDIPLPIRLWMTGADLVRFAPLYASIVAIAFLLALPVAAWIAQRWPQLRTLMFALAGIIGIAVAIRLVDALVPPPVLIAATRGTGGWLLMAFGGAIGAVVYARHTQARFISRTSE